MKLNKAIGRAAKSTATFLEKGKFAPVLHINPFIPEKSSDVSLVEYSAIFKAQITMIDRVVKEEFQALPLKILRKGVL